MVKLDRPDVVQVPVEREEAPKGARQWLEKRACAHTLPTPTQPSTRTRLAHDPPFVGMPPPCFQCETGARRARHTRNNVRQRQVSPCYGRLISAVYARACVCVCVPRCPCLCVCARARACACVCVCVALYPSTPASPGLPLIQNNQVTFSAAHARLFCRRSGAYNSDHDHDYGHGRAHVRTCGQRRVCGYP